METRTQISEKLLNEKIMDLLHTRPACRDARSVMLDIVSDAGVPYNWNIYHFDPGNGDRYICKLALRSIHENLRNDFEMIGRS